MPLRGEADPVQSRVLIGSKSWRLFSFCYFNPLDEVFEGVAAVVAVPMRFVFC